MMEKEKEETLSSLLQSYGSAAVALSGGVDSAVLLVAAVRTLGAANVVAATMSPPSQLRPSFWLRGS